MTEADPAHASLGSGPAPLSAWKAGQQPLAKKPCGGAERRDLCVLEPTGA